MKIYPRFSDNNIYSLFLVDSKEKSFLATGNFLSQLLKKKYPTEKFLFPAWKHKFAVWEHKFPVWKHKYPVWKHKISLREKTKSQLLRNKNACSTDKKKRACARHALLILYIRWYTSQLQSTSDAKIRLKKMKNQFGGLFCIGKDYIV